ncbi:PREDICTED: uncharacterized protein LOC105571087 [Vollenhovia emeryi]|uniref:uncharacterized protein LOC105571087 n=1 Tax=Vollenhovia emeryi TaxID=411798 RepID=UPI0005F4C883|nr:PREDICTED: uncharacterized protein LOC105571087 [Vollenhovia emeryi]
MFNFLSNFQKGLKNKRKDKRGKERKRNIWLLFRATDFASLMYPCFTVCRIMGLFSYKFNASNIKTYKPSYILSTIVMCVFCTAYSIVFNDIIIAKNMPIVTDVDTPRILEQASEYVFGGFIVVTTLILTKPRMRFLQTIMEVSSKLPPQSFQNLSRLIHAKDIFVILFIIMSLVKHFSTMLQNISIFRKLVAPYMILLIFQMNMLYMDCVCILKACFKQINDSLMNLRELFTNGEPCLLSGTYRAQRTPFILLEITALKKQHLAINDAVRMLNMVFSLQLVATILMAFAHITFNMYYFFGLLIQNCSTLTNFERQALFKYFIVSIMCYIITLGMILWACETGKNQALEIKSTVREVLNNTNNKQIKYELNLFSLQLLHCENVFSTKWINMDTTLATVFIGSVTTNLAILVQFAYMSNTCEENLSNNKQ